MYSMIFAIYPKAGMTREECGAYLANEHSKIGARMPGARTLRYFEITGTHEPRDTEVAAFTLLEFDSEEDFAAAAAGPVMAEANADMANFADHGAVYNVRATNVV